MDIIFTVDKFAKILSWKVKEGRRIFAGNILFDYCECDKNGVETGSNVKLKFKSPQSGVVRQILSSEGSVIEKGSPLASVVQDEECSHPVVIDDMCGVCSADLRKLDDPPASSATVAMVHSIPALKVSMEDAQQLSKLDEQHLTDKKIRKLVLLVDLDQTLIHTTNDNVPHNLEDVIHFQLRSHGSVWYHTRLRPGTRQFLENINKLFQLHICTFGTRHYANTIATYLDPEKKYFSDRILSRDECFSSNSKTANLKELFPRGDHMVCIIDDREDVWNFAKNLIHVKPYHFFRHTGDINAPPGLTKMDNDDKIGFEFPSDHASSTAEKPVNMNQSSPSTKEELEPDVKNGTTVSNELQSTAVSSESCKGPLGSSLDDGEVINSSECATSSKESGIEAQQTKEEMNEGDCAAPTTETETSKNNLSDSGVQEVHAESDLGDTEIPSTETSETLDAETSNKASTDEATANDLDDKEEGELPTDSSTSSENGGLVKVEDTDDYLLYLETILSKIHKAYYDLYDDMVRSGTPGVPDVKNVIPYVRQKVLKGASIVFSGVIPTQVPLEKSKQYAVAVSLGAHVSSKIIPAPKAGMASKLNEPRTTHVVAAKEGTAKVNEARKRHKGIHIVTPDWLWQCAERWEWCDEKLFLLFRQSRVKRHPPPHCSSPDGAFRPSESDNTSESLLSSAQTAGTNESRPSTSKGANPAIRKERTPSGRFMDTINPLLTFSMDEIEKMDHEVDDIFNESDSSSTEEEAKPPPERTPPRRKKSRTLTPPIPPVRTKSRDESSSDTTDDSDTEIREGHVLGKRKRSSVKTETETEDEPLSARFRRGEPLPSDLDTLNLNSGSSDDDDGNNKGDDQDDDWMAEALEREFLDDNDISQDSI